MALECLALGADLNWKNSDDDVPPPTGIQDDQQSEVNSRSGSGPGSSSRTGNTSGRGKTPLMDALEGGNVVLAQFLLQWNCDINLTDASGSTALHYATRSNLGKIVAVLLKRNVKDETRNQMNQVLSFMCQVLTIDLE